MEVYMSLAFTDEFEKLADSKKVQAKNRKRNELQRQKRIKASGASSGQLYQQKVQETKGALTAPRKPVEKPVTPAPQAPQQAAPQAPQRAALNQELDKVIMHEAEKGKTAPVMTKTKDAKPTPKAGTPLRLGKWGKRGVVAGGSVLGLSALAYGAKKLLSDKKRAA